MLTLTFLGFAFEHMLRPVIPLIVLGRGGDAALVGIVVAVNAVPSVLFRPWLGRLVDGGRHAQLLRLGAVGATVSPLGVLLPGIVSLTIVRFIQGAAWALYGVSTHTLLAKVSSPDRRGQASGYYMAMPALASLLVPGAGVALYAVTGEVGPALVASAFALVATALALRTKIPETPLPAPARPDAQRGAARDLFRLIEPSAAPGALMLTLFMAAASLFIVFPPVYAVAVGAPIESLVVYYPVFGLVQTTSQLFGGWVSDNVGRGAAIRLGCAMGVLGLGIAGLGDGMVTFTAGGAAYAVGVSLVAPATSAMTIDRAPAERLGAAMALYSLGFQLASGASGVVWGAIVAVGGFFWAFAVAGLLQAATFAVSLRFSRSS